MSRDKKQDAVLLCRWNVALHLESWNAYDSLGEALLDIGNLEEARTKYQKSLALNPDNQNAVEVLKRLDNNADLDR